MKCKAWNAASAPSPIFRPSLPSRPVPSISIPCSKNASPSCAPRTPISSTARAWRPIIRASMPTKISSKACSPICSKMPRRPSLPEASCLVSQRRAVTRLPSKYMIPVPVSARRRAARYFNRLFPSSAAAWAWAFRLRVKAPCSRAATFCWFPASSEEPRSVSFSPSLSFLALALLPVLLTAQPILRVPVRLVVAPTSVTDRGGNFINGLTAADFQLYDNDVPQQVHEDDDFLPISMAIAIQTDLKKEAIARVRELGPLLGALVVGVGGEAGIFAFKDQLQVRQDFTPDLGRLTHALRRMEFSPGPNHVIDATLDAIRLLDQRPEGRRRILLLISEPRDLGSQSTLDDALSAVGASNTLIYWLNVARGAATEDPVPVLTR